MMSGGARYAKRRKLIVCPWAASGAVTAHTLNEAAALAGADDGWTSVVAAKPV